MTIDEIRAANRASALEQLEVDKRNEEAKAEMMAVRLVNGRPPRRRRYYTEDEPGEERREVERDNAAAVEVETHRYDEQNN